MSERNDLYKSHLHLKLTHPFYLVFINRKSLPGPYTDTTFLKKDRTALCFEKAEDAFSSSRKKIDTFAVFSSFVKN